MPTRLSARSAKPVGRNTPRSLGFEQLFEGSVGADLAGESRQELDVAPLSQLTDFDEGDRALVGIAHALKGLEVEPRTDEHSQLRLTRGVAQRFVPKDLAQGRSRKKGREHQAGEEAFVTLAAPRVQTLFEHLAKGSIAATKDVVIDGQSAKGPRYPDFAAIAQEAGDDELRSHPLA